MCQFSPDSGRKRTGNLLNWFPFTHLNDQDTAENKSVYTFPEHTSRPSPFPRCVSPLRGLPPAHTQQHRPSTCPAFATEAPQPPHGVEHNCPVGRALYPWMRSLGKPQATLCFINWSFLPEVIGDFERKPPPPPSAHETLNTIRNLKTGIPGTSENQTRNNLFKLDRLSTSFPKGTMTDP